jgi:hypothetical protein
MIKLPTNYGFHELHVFLKHKLHESRCTLYNSINKKYKLFIKYLHIYMYMHIVFKEMVSDKTPNKLWLP